MIAVLLIIMAASCASLSNLFLRKNGDKTPSAGSHFYLLNYYIGSFLLSFVLFPSLWGSSVNWVVVGLGSCVGALNVALMTTTAQALRNGPSGLTFAFQNATAVFPGAILYVLFGSQFGFSCSYFQIAGMGLVIYGLFIGTRQKEESTSTAISRWLVYALACGLFQVLGLTLMQGRCILFQQENLGPFLSKLALEEGDDAWFMPAQFGTAAILQTLFFFKQIKKQALPISSAFGLSAGLSNGACTFFILLATKLALPSFKVILFPCFAALVIILCNLWANRLYKEKFNFQTNLFCAAGILLGILA